MFNKLRTKVNAFIDSIPSEYKSVNTNTNTDTNTDTDTDIVHKIIIEKMISIFNDAGLQIRLCEINPSSGCNHTNCRVSTEIFIPMVEKDKMGQEQDMVKACIKSTILIAFSEVLGKSKLLDENYIITNFGY